MKYNININQKGLQYDTNISLTDASVIDWIHTFCGTNNRKINNQKVDGWTWVNCNHLITDMPLLRIKTRAGGAKLLQRLADLGYIEKKTEGRKLFIKPTDKIDSLYFDKVVVSPKNQAVSQSIHSCKLEDTNHNTNNIILNTKEGVRKLTEGDRKFLFKVSYLWKDMVAKHLDMPAKNVVLTNILYPLKALYFRDNYNYDDFKELFGYFLDDTGIKRTDKMSFNLALSEKYVAKFKIHKRSKNKPLTNSQIAESIRL